MLLLNEANLFRFGPAQFSYVNTLGDGVTIDDSAEKCGYKFYSAVTNEITAVDLVLQYYGDTSGITFRVGVYADSGGEPGALLGSASATFSGEASAVTKWAGGGTNPITLTSGTGALSIGVPYWVVLDVTAGTLNGTNYIKTKRLGGQLSRWFYRGYSGSWGTLTQTAQPLIVLKHGTAGYTGMPLIDGTSLASTNPANHIYDNYRQGLKFRFGSKLVLRGFYARFDIDPAPEDLVFSIYRGSTLVTSEQISIDIVGDTQSAAYLLSSPPTLDANTDYYAVFAQKGSTSDNDDGGDGSNDYMLAGSTLPAAYWTCLLPAEWYYVHGTGNDPTAFTAIHTFAPILLPIIADFTTDLISAAPRFGDMTGGLR